MAVSEGGLESSGDEDSAVLPPSGRGALFESDPELTAMLSRRFLRRSVQLQCILTTKCCPWRFSATLAAKAYSSAASALHAMALR